MEAADRDTLTRLLSEIDAVRVHCDAQGRPSLKKPLLLLLVLSKLGAGALQSNRIHFTDIEKELADLIKRFGLRGGGGSASPEEPFVYLATAVFWHLHYPAGTEDKPRVRRSKRVLRDPNTYAYLAEDVYALLKGSRAARGEVLRRIIARWWDGNPTPELYGAVGLGKAG